jgi:hypothetical protein
VKPKKRVILLLALSSAILLYGYIKVFNGKANKPYTHILYQVGFEENDPLPSFISKQTATAYGLQIVGSPVYQGKKAMRFELRAADPENNNGTRAEISFPKPDDKSNPERWYAFALYFPRDGYEADSSDEVICQWHQGGKATPALCIRTKNDRITLRIKSDLKSKEKVDLGAIEKDTWHYYVLHVKHSAGDDGLVEIWRDGQLIAQSNGANMYDLARGFFHAPSWKLGIYKSSWNKEGVTNSNKRVLYFDEIKLGDERASLNDMMVKPK